MPTNRLRGALEHLRRALAPRGDGATDGQLLARFVAGRDEEALRGAARRALGKVRDKETLDATGRLESALKALKEARDQESRRRAVESLDAALRWLKERERKERPKEGSAPARK